MWLSSDVTWRPSVEFYVPAPSHRQLYKKRSTKVGSRSRRRPAARLFHSWTGKRIPQLVVPDSVKDEEKIVKCSRSDSLVPNFLKDEESDSIGYRSCDKETISQVNGFVEEPWLSLSPDHAADLDDKSNCFNGGKQILKFINGHHQTSKYINHKVQFDVNDVNIAERHNSQSNYPVEEPWIFESSTYGVHSSVQLDSDISTDEFPDDKLTPTIPDQHRLIPETLFQEEESDVTTEEDSVSTVILINSSLCTMQRIAVIENDELVELLLEPVKSTVQCDSVYLGVLTKLVPHMGGAFVNIGSSRPSFMDIKPNREPFILTSLHDRMKEKEADGPISNKAAEHAALPEIPIFSDRVAEQEEFEDDQSEDEFAHEEFGSDENLFHLNVIESIKENLNGSVVRQEHDNDTHGSAEPLSEDVVKRHNHRKSSVEENKWAQVQEGSMIIVQVVKEGLGTKGPTLTAYPKLKSRFWVLIARSNTIGISKKISGVERTRLRVIAKSLQPPGFGLTVRTVASGQSLEELQKDLEGLLSTWKSIVDHAKSAALAADEGVDGAVPVMLHRAMGQTLSIVQDYFNEKVKSMVVDSPRTYHEVTNYLQDIAPDLCDRVELYSKRTPLFDEYNIEDEISSILSKRVPLANGGYLVIEQTEALVSIDVNGGQCMLGQGTSQEKAILEVNLAAAKQIARELRLRDIGGIIVVDFIDMVDDSNKRLVYEEVKKAVERDRSIVKVSELSRHGLMEITRKRVRPSVTFMISEPCTCCHATGRVEALETTFSKIEHEICRLLSKMDQKADPGNSKSWPRLILRVDRHMCNYLTSGKRTRLALLSSSLKVWILLKVARGLTRGTYELKRLTDESLQDDQHHNTIPVLRPTNVVSYSPTRNKVTFFPIKKMEKR